MTSFRPFFLVSLFACAMGLASGARAQPVPAGEKFQPRLSPHFTVGQSFGFQASARLDYTDRIVELKQDASMEKITEDTLANVRENYGLELQTDGALARAVFPNGTLREVDFLVKRAVIIQSDGKTEMLAPAGAVLGARKLDDGHTVVFIINGKPPTADVANDLGMLIRLGDPETTDDQLFGPSASVPVGGSWVLNPKLLLGSSFTQGFPGASQAAGSMTLHGVQRDGAGRLVATVSGAFRLSGVKPQFPPQVQARPSTVEYQYEARAPVSAGEGEHGLHVTTLIHHEGVTGNITDGFSESRRNVSITLDQSANITIDSSRAPIRALAAAPGVPNVAPAANALSATSAQFVSRDLLDAEKKKMAANASPGKSPAGATASAAPPRPPANPTAPPGLSLSSQPAPTLTGKTSAANPATLPAATTAVPIASLPTAPGVSAPSPNATGAVATQPPQTPAAPTPVPPVPAAPPSLPSLDLSPAPSPFAGARPLNSPASASTLSGAQPLTPSANSSPLAGAKPLTPANASGNSTSSPFASATPLTPARTTSTPNPAAPPPANPSPFAGALPLMPGTGNTTGNATTNTTVSPFSGAQLLTPAPSATPPPAK